MNRVDRKAVNVLLAALGMEQHEFAALMGYDEGYVSNVLNGFTETRPAFRRAFGETIGSLVLGTFEREVRESYPAGPLLELISQRAARAVSKRDFYRDLGTSAQALKNRKCFDGLFVDRICCRLGVHLSALYGSNYGVAEAS